MGRFSRSRRTYLPPAVAIDVILLHDLYTVSGLEIDFVGILWSEVEQSIDVFGHFSQQNTDYLRGVRFER